MRWHANGRFHMQSKEHGYDDHPTTRTRSERDTMSRRKRCPYCKSLNTVPYIAGTKEGLLTGEGWVCEDCDIAFNSRERQVDGEWIKIPNHGAAK